MKTKSFVVPTCPAVVLLTSRKNLKDSLWLESSPTIRVNGHDIQFEVKESVCSSCSDLSGVETDWHH
ncbi:DUF2703 domain-containing protein [Bacillota bacterium LX-D]|nr:DUF2703 domain-containing protein [Bacillota bacterium LX-D]